MDLPGDATGEISVLYPFPHPLGGLNKVLERRLSEWTCVAFLFDFFHDFIPEDKLTTHSPELQVFRKNPDTFIASVIEAKPISETINQKA